MFGPRHKYRPAANKALPATNPFNATSNSSSSTQKVQQIEKEKKKKASNLGIPLENCFMDQFELTLSSDRQEKLEQCFIEVYEGGMPNRAQLKELSIKLGSSQARIRKWFYDRIIKEEQRQKLQESEDLMSEGSSMLENLYESIKSN